MKKRKQNIIDVSLKLFTELGFEGTTTAKIAEKAGINPGTLFNEFDTKNELINELHDYSKNEVVNALESYPMKANSLKEVMFDIWNILIELGLKRPEIIRYIFNYNYSSFGAKLPKEQSERELRFFTKIYDKYMNNIIPEGRKEILTLYLLHCILILIDYIEENPKDNEVKTRSFNILWNGFKFYEAK